jgi:hypothetical protein
MTIKELNSLHPCRPQKVLCHSTHRYGATSGLAIIAMAKSFQLPANCEANSQQDSRAATGRPPRRSNASVVLAEDLRQALRQGLGSKVAPSRPPGQQGAPATPQHCRTSAT